MATTIIVVVERYSAAKAKVAEKMTKTIYVRYIGLARRLAVSATTTDHRTKAYCRQISNFPPKEFAIIHGDTCVRCCEPNAIWSGLMLG